ncbi:MAG: bifunctional riboflavin kinase/FAD synthetase [Gammaproteobacteria bacterium]|nr:bifunctional riboflavin kinase/FAD synthetase [Gammaproteobacteria bacterium]
MQLIRGLHNLKSTLVSGSVVTIGNYDGVHLGHRKILNFVKEKSIALNLPSVVVIFEPQPEEFFAQDQALRLTSLREKIFGLSQCGMDKVVLLPFNRHFATISAMSFVAEVLICLLHVKYLVVGDDFVFGHRREGGFSLLEREAVAGGFGVTQIPSFKIDGVRVSSSLIRAALLSDNFDLAAKFLGRPYSVNGRVIHGEHRGRDLGFPTANIHLNRPELPLTGVYLVKVFGLKPSPLFGLANIGFRPTVSGKQKSFEVYIFEFNANIYGKRITVEFCKKIRDEKKFESVTELQAQIKKDLEMVGALI